MPTPANVHVLTLGGTIAMRDEGQGATPTLDASELLGGVAVDGVEITAEAFRQVPSAALTIADLAALAEHIRAVVADGTDGVVVTQGTDTLAESAFTLDLLLEIDAPVVFTGAMRHPTLLSPDGPANLVNAVRTAAADDTRGIGVVVVMNDEVHAARHVRKSNTMSTAAFNSAGSGPIGWVVEEQVRLLTRPSGRTITLPQPRRDVAVALLASAIGDDLRLVDLVAESGYEGVVVEAFGAGHVPPWTVQRLAEATAQLPVVFASRVGAGPTLTRTYGYPGSERDLRSRGLVGAGWLDGAKARVLLTLVLASPGTNVAEAFTAFGGG